MVKKVRKEKISKEGFSLKLKGVFWILTAFFICYTVLSYLEPRALDDWVWGSHIGMERLKNGFSGYNGRYVGNLIVIVMERLPELVCALCQSAMMTCLLYLLYCLTGKKLIASAITIAFTIFLPLSMFSQTYVWVSGYANYIVSLFILIVYLLIAGKVYMKEFQAKKVVLPVVFILSVLSQLVVENVTILLVSGIAVLNVIYLIQYKKISRDYLVCLAGSVVGSIIMFSNNAYSAALSSDTSVTYKKIEGDFFSIPWFSQVWDKFTTETVKLWFMENGILNMILCSVMILFCYRAAVKFCKVWVSFYAFGLGYFVFCHFNGNWNYYFPFMQHIQGIYVLLFCLSIVFVIATNVTQTKFKFMLLLTLLSQIPLILPLVIANPVSPRCFVSTYTLFALFLGQLIYYMMEQEWFFVKNRRQAEKYMTLALCTGIVVVFGLYSMIYGFMKEKAAERVEYILEQVDKGEKEIEIFYLPYSDKYTVYTNPRTDDSYWTANYRRYYKLPQNITFSYCKYEEWQEKYGTKK